jgi:hypothetical protein
MRHGVKKEGMVCLAAVLCAVWLLGTVRQVRAVDIIVNGSFETGDFTGWVTKDMAVPFFALEVRGVGISPGFGLFLSAPTNGTFAVTHGFDGGGPDSIEISQDVSIPAGFSATLTFDWRAGWDLVTFGGGSQPRLFDVVIEPAGGGTPLSTTNILTANPQTQVLDTGPNSGGLDLSAFAGTSIRVKFKATIPENFTGPAHLQIDHVVLDIQPIDDDGDGVVNTADVCPNTVIPESVPTERLGVNRFALVDGDDTFDTTAPYGVGPQRRFTIRDTAGCSCEQIIAELGLGEGHTRFGCSLGAMQEWIAQVNP